MTFFASLKNVMAIELYHSQVKAIVLGNYPVFISKAVLNVYTLLLIVIIY